MELWIRSQDRERLIKVDGIKTYCSESYKDTLYELEDCKYNTLGSYKSKERVLNILDEISNKIKNQFILKEKTILKPEDLLHHKRWLEYEYNCDFIAQDESYEIHPINSNIIYYEMPEE